MEKSGSQCAREWYSEGWGWGCSTCWWRSCGRWWWHARRRGLDEAASEPPQTKAKIQTQPNNSTKRTCYRSLVAKCIGFFHILANKTPDQVKPPDPWPTKFQIPSQAYVGLVPNADLVPIWYYFPALIFKEQTRPRYIISMRRARAAAAMQQPSESASSAAEPKAGA